MAYRSSVIDVPIIGLSQSEPEHGGPEGRATALKDAQVTHYTPANTREPQKVRIEPREAFVSMPSELRLATTGAVDALDWGNPHLLDSLGDQLLSICGGKPRVYNGSTWTSYSDKRVVTNKLSQDVLHTTNHVLQASDSARVGNVTCSAWTETTPSGGGGTQYQPTVAFRADDGSWVRTPFTVFSNAPGQPTTVVRVVSDGTFFWVVTVIPSVSKVGVWVYDVHGAQVATDTTTIPLTWGAAPGYWDIAAPLPGATPFVALVQPAANTTVGANVGATWWKMTVAGAVITITTGALTGSVAAKCQGQIAFMANDGEVARMWVATVGAANTVFAYLCDLNMGTMAEYAFGAVLNGSGIPDSLTGWGEFNGGARIAHVAYSMLSNFAPAAGPANDPGLRYTRSYKCTSGGAVTLVNQTNGVLLSSRAFQIDADWYAATYYQSGGGLAAATLQTVAVDGALDYFTGQVVQPIPVQDGDSVTGAAFTVGTADAYPTQTIASVVHDAADNVLAGPAGQHWHFINAGFAGSGGTYGSTTWVGNDTAIASILHISGAANADNNGDWFINGVVSNTDVLTDPVSAQGRTAVTETFGAGVTVSVSQSWILVVPVPPNPVTVGGYASGNVSQPEQDMVNGFVGGVATIAGASGAAVALNGTYAVRRIAFNYIPAPSVSNLIVLGKTSGAAGPSGGHYVVGSTSGATASIAPLTPDRWTFLAPNVSIPPANRVLFSLVVSGDINGGNNGVFPVGTTGIGHVVDTPTQPTLIAERFTTPNIPAAAIVLADAGRAMVFHFAAFTFDVTYLGAYISVAGALATSDNGVYQIVNLIDSHTVKVIPADGHLAQVVYNMNSFETVTISKLASASSPAFQPCWFLMPLSIHQRAAGRWDWGVAFADWRKDGATKANTGTFERNGFPLALSSVVASADGQAFVLPYRAQSFTAGQVVSNATTQVGLAFSAQSTVGLKLFNVGNSPGLALPAAERMLLPGLQATQFSASGFPEDGVNLGAETPFLVAQATVALAFALSLNAAYQYVVVFEVTNENGDRTWSTVSPPLAVTTTGTNNQVTIGGRMPGPTNRIVGVAIYRTSNIVGVPTIQHYKITNDLDVNGAGFTFTSINGGADSDTWQFVDTVPDAQITSSEVVYTDKSLLQRFPAPAYSQGVSGWKARDWVVGYDGAVWMSGEKVEGDAVWWHPAFRYTAFGDDTPVSVCPMDEYLIVHCERTVWYIPADRFPDATGRTGTLPNPVQLPMQNGGTGFALAIRAGVVYSSTAGGVWLITRDLQNLWLSEDVRDSLTTVAGMAIDGNQRLWVTTGTNSLWIYDQITKGWWEWRLPQGGNPFLIGMFQGNGVYTNNLPVLYTPGVYLDLIDGDSSGIAMDVTFASLEFGGVRSYKCLWACQIVGVYKGPHRLNAVMSYPDEDGQAPTTFTPYAPNPAKPYIFEINPMVEEASCYALRMFVDFVGVGTPGNSCQIELMSFEVGLEGGINRIPSSRRVKGT